MVKKMVKNSFVDLIGYNLVMDNDCRKLKIKFFIEVFYGCR